MKSSFLCLLLLLVFTGISIRSQDDRGIKDAPVLRMPDGSETQFYSGGSYALVIGMSKYRHLKRLEGPDRDVDEVSALLSEQGFKVTPARDLDSKTLKETVQKFLDDTSKVKDRRIIIYFAGHGWTLDALNPPYNKIGYIVPIDAPDPTISPESETKFRQLAINTEVIQGWAKSIETTHSLFVFDSCFSGFVARGEPRMPLLISNKLARASRQFISSGSANETVPDNSIFRKYFVDGLRGAADSNNDGWIQATELFRYIEEKVLNEAINKGYSQTPQQFQFPGSDMNGDMIFARGLPKSIANEKDAWEEVQRQNNPGWYTRFINSYPTSSNFSKARKLFFDTSKESSNESPEVKVSATTPVRGPEPREEPYVFRTITTNESGSSLGPEERTTKKVELDLGGGTKIVLVKIMGGTLKRDATGPKSPASAQNLELRDFYVGAYEISRRQWAAVAEKIPEVSIYLRPQPGPPGDDNLPVTYISWDEAKEFCERLSRHFGGKLFDLPTEVEWEFAARAGAPTRFAFGPAITSDIANVVRSPKPGTIAAPIPGTLASIDRYEPNRNGLYNIHGNAAEWCFDQWESDSQRKVVRGGSYALPSDDACLTCRTPVPKNVKDPKVGFRIVLRTEVRSN